MFVRSEQKQKEEMNKRNKDGLTTQAKPSVAEMILNKRLGRLVATMGPGSGFGELALLEKRAGANKRSASCICPLDSATQGATAEPCHLLTLERSVYIRLSKIGDKSVGTEIGTKVRTIQDSIAFSWWPRSQVVQFSINLQVVNLLKDDILVQAGEPADKFFLIAGGEVEETQPITLKWDSLAPKSGGSSGGGKVVGKGGGKGVGKGVGKGGGKGGDKGGGAPFKVIYPWGNLHTKADGTSSTRLKKIRVSLGSYGALDFVGAVPVISNFPFHLTTLKAACKNTTVICIGRAHFEHQVNRAEEIGSKFHACFQKTVRFLKKNVRLREMLRKQRVRASLAAPEINVTITREMTRSFSLCGRCGRSGHGWGETNEYGMLRCPLAQGAGERAHNKDDNMEGRRKQHQHKRRMRRQSMQGLSSSFGGSEDEVDIAHAKLVKKLSGSSRWSKAMSQKMRGGTPCTIGSLSSLLSNMSTRDERMQAAAIRRSKHGQIKRDSVGVRPSTAGPAAHSPISPVAVTGRVRRPATAAAADGVSHSYLHAKKHGSAVKLPHPSTSPLRKHRSQKVADLYNVMNLHGEEAVSAYVRRQMEFVYVMPEEVGFEEESERMHDAALEHALLD